MAVNNPIIDSGPSSTRSRNKEVIVREAGAVPPETYIKSEDGVFSAIAQEAQRLGQFCYYREAAENGSRATATMYVVVDAGDDEEAGPSGLTWKPVRSEVTFIDTDTGKPWNPISELGS